VNWKTTLKIIKRYIKAAPEGNGILLPSQRVFFKKPGISAE
jgi:hypothetical protein